MISVERVAGESDSDDVVVKMPLSLALWLYKLLDGVMYADKEKKDLRSKLESVLIPRKTK